VWPPPPTSTDKAVSRALFLAGGVGINPLMAMLAHLDGTGEMGALRRVDVVYSVRVPEEGFVVERVLFLSELLEVQERWRVRLSVHLFVTGEVGGDHGQVFSNKRVTREDLRDMLDGDVDETVAYVCGPPDMTDDLVLFLQEEICMPKDRVLCEKWW
jgi:NAD(P)H-flavin reductase